MHLTDGYYEIIGTVKDDKSVKALTSIELGPKLGKSRLLFPLHLPRSRTGELTVVLLLWMPTNAWQGRLRV